MKSTTRSTINAALILLTAGMAAGQVGCSCSGDGETDEETFSEEAPEAVEVATASVSPANSRPEPIPVEEEEEEEQPLPVEEPPAVPEPEPEPEPAEEEPPPEPAEPERDYPLQAVAYQFVTNVVDEPGPRARIIGYLRRGARVRVTERVRGRGCERGWHEVEGGGFVCRADGVVVGENPEDWPDAPSPPILENPLPYLYYSSARDNVPEYRELPSREQEAQAARVIRALRLASEGEGEAEDGEGEASESSDGEGSESGAEASDETASGEGGEASREQESDESPTRQPEPAGAVEGEAPGLPAPVRTLLQRGFIVSSNQISGRWIRTARGRYVDRTKMADRDAPEFQGTELGEELTLPLAFVTRGRAKALRPQAGTGLRFEVAGTLRRLTALPVLGEVMRGDQRYISVGRRLLVRSNVLALVEPVDRPPEVGPEERWIDIDLSNQTLVAYEGDRPVYSTLVSTGRSADGFGTPTGVFHILTKHVSATMDDPDGGAEAYSIEDVPWTMYFHESYALHGAFWHNNFGRERSHGCVNLAPADARWLFFWAGPELPPGWHGVRSSREHPGTAVVIRP